MKSIGIRSKPKHLLVRSIKRDGSFNELHNGPGGIVWDVCVKMQKNGQRRISTRKMANLMNKVPEKQRLARIVETAC